MEEVEDVVMLEMKEKYRQKDAEGNTKSQVKCTKERTMNTLRSKI